MAMLLVTAFSELIGPGCHTLVQALEMKTFVVSFQAKMARVRLDLLFLPHHQQPAPKATWRAKAPYLPRPWVYARLLKDALDEASAWRLIQDVQTWCGVDTEVLSAFEVCSELVSDQI